MEKKDVAERVRLIIDVVSAEPIEDIHKRCDDDAVYGAALQKESAVLVMLNRLYDELTGDINF